MVSQVEQPEKRQKNSRSNKCVEIEVRRGFSNSPFAKRRFTPWAAVSLSLPLASAADTVIFCPHLFSGLFGGRSAAAARVLTRPICQQQEGTERDTCVFAGPDCARRGLPFFSIWDLVITQVNGASKKGLRPCRPLAARCTAIMMT